MTTPPPHDSRHSGPENRGPSGPSSRHLQRRLFDRAPDPLCVIDGHGWFRVVNPALARALGQTVDELLSRPMAHFLDPADPRPSLAATAAGAARGQHVEIENRYWTPGGATVRILWHVSPVDGADLAYAVGRLLPETRAEAGRQPADLEAQDFRALLEHTSDYVQVATPSGRLTYVNRAWLDVLGHPADAVASLLITDVLHPHSLPTWFDAVAQVSRRARVSSLRLDLISRDGRTVPVEGSVSGVLDGERFVAVSALLRDARHASSSVLRDAFVTSINHEMRTPLTSVRGSLGLLLGGVAGELPEDARRLLEVARRNEARLSRHLAGVLDLQRLESGRTPMVFRALDLARLVEDGIAAFPGEVSLERPATDVLVRGDADHIGAVIQAVLASASHIAAPERPLAVCLREGADGVVLDCLATGAGLDAAQRRRLASPFEVGASAEPAAPAGGLELAIARAIVERHGGDLDIDGAGDKGTRFRVTFPSCAPSEEAATRPARDALVLIVEDDAATAEIIRALVLSVGYRADIASDVATARALLGQQRYDAMTLDMMLPDQDGSSFLDDLRHDPRTRDLPVVVVSARSGQDGAGPRSRLPGAAVPSVDKSRVAEQLVERLDEVMARGTHPSS